MLKKAIGIVIIACLIIAMLSACGKSAGTTSASDGTAEATTSAAATEAEPATTAAESFKISVASWMLSATNANAQPFMDLVEKNYKAKYPGATIEWNPIQGEKYHDLLKAQLATQTAPDIFFFQNAIVPFGKAGYLVDLSSQSWAPDILPSTKADVTYDGKLLAAPVDVAGWGTFYNKKVFTDLGIEVPKTFAEFLDICKKANEKGIVALTGGYKEWQNGSPSYGLQSFLYGTNKNIASDLYDGKTKINGPEFNALYTALDQMVKAGVYPKNILSTTYDQAVQLVGEGKAAMMFDGPWLCATMATKYPDTELGFFVVPDTNGNAYMTSSVNQALGLNAAYKDRQKGLDMIDTIVTKEAIAALLQNSSFAGLKGYDVPQNSTGANDYSAALSKYQTDLQFTAWIPASAYGLFINVCTKIVAGKGFDPKDLDASDTAYQKDKALINVVK